MIVPIPDLCPFSYFENAEIGDTSGRQTQIFLKQMGKITNDQWVLSLIKHGYKLEFLKIHAETGVRQTHDSAKHTIILNHDVEKILGKIVIEPVPLAELNQGFYSTLFLVPKKTGDLRPIINLKPLNQYL